jgi:hypothetical protein
MDMPTEPALRFPAWLIAAAVVVGVGLGFWQVGVFDRSTAGESGAHVAASQARSPASTAAVDVTAGESASPINWAIGRRAERPLNAIDQLESEQDSEVREESIALQDALAAEQASD